MDNKDFDKLFSEKLNETQSFEYMEADWDNVASRISQPKKKNRRSGGWLWLFGLGFLFMAGTSIYLANTLNKTNNHLVELKTAVAELEQELQSSATIEKVDTIFKQVTVTHYDTLNVATTKKQIIPQQSMVGNDFSDKELEAKMNHRMLPRERDIQKVKADNNSNTIFAKSLTDKQELSNDYKAIETKTKTKRQANIETSPSNNKVLGIESLWMRSLSSSLLPGKMKWEPIDGLSEVPAAVKVNKKKKLAWKYLSIGITGGSFLSRELKNGSDDGTLEYTEFDYTAFGAVALKNRYGWEVGVVLGYQLGARFNLIGSVHFQRNIYSGNGGVTSAINAIRLFETETSPFAGEFALNPFFGDVDSNNTYTFKQSMIAYQLGANYSFRKNKKWRPYLGLSLSATSILKQTLFVDSGSSNNGGSNNGNYNLEPRTKLAESKPIKSSFRFTGIVPTAGFQMALNPKTSWQMEAWYRQGFNKEKDYLYGLLGLRTGVSYRF